MNMQEIASRATQIKQGYVDDFSMRVADAQTLTARKYFEVSMRIEVRVTPEEALWMLGGGEFPQREETA